MLKYQVRHLPAAAYTALFVLTSDSIEALGISWYRRIPDSHADLNP